MCDVTWGRETALHFYNYDANYDAVSLKVEKTTEYDIILKESIRFRAEKENSFIQKIKLLGM